MLDLRDLALPIVCAPMAGGPTTPALVAAVSEAGGLGFLAAGYKTAAALQADIDAVRGSTSAPYGVNVFLVERNDPDPRTLAKYAGDVGREAERLGVPLGEPRFDDDDWNAKVEVLMDAAPDVVSFTFGCPSAAVLDALEKRGVLTAVTVTTVDEARAAVAAGAASLAVQGPEAGGHRGTWDQEAAPNSAPLGELLAQVLGAVAVPVVAGGGVARVADVASLLEQGAIAAQVGSAYLLADEAGTNLVHRASLIDPAFAETAVTRAYTGRWARGLANRFIREHADAPAGYPQLHHLTSPLRAAAIRAGDAEVAHMWAGTGHSGARAGAAAEITRSLTP